MNLVETITCYDACNKLNLIDESKKLKKIINIVLDKTLEENTGATPDCEKETNIK
jgi:hypothetical protein